MSKPHLAVIVPAYNEEPRIEKSLRRIGEYLDGTGYEWRVIVVSDGSTDRTNEIVETVAAEDDRFQLIAYEPNCGKGRAVRTGMVAADAEWLLLSDADLAAPIEEVEKLFAAGTAVAIGSRALAKSDLKVRQPWYREFLGRCFNRR